MDALTISGLLSGFQNRSAQIRDQQTQLQQAENARHERIFDALANSDDPDIRAAAVTGMLTGAPPGKGLSKWFGQVQQHPAFETIKGLVGEGHQPFLGTEGKAEATARGNIQGRLGGVVSAERAAGYEPTPEDISAMGRGMVGTPPKSFAPVAYNGEYLDPADGQWKTGTIIEQNGRWLVGGVDVQGQVRNLTKPSGPHAEARPRIATMDATAYEKMYGPLPPGMKGVGRVQVQMDEHNQPIGSPSPTTEPPPTFTYIPTTNGIMVGDTHHAGLSPAPGGAGVSHPETPSAGLAALRGIDASVRAAAGPRPKGLGGLDPTPQQLQQWQAGLDSAAKNFGYENYAALQAAMGQAGTEVQGAVPGAGGPPEVPVAPDARAGKKGKGRGKEGAAGAAGAAAAPQRQPGDRINEVVDFLKSMDAK